MNKQTLQKIDDEVIDLIRRIVISEKRDGNLERSAFILLRQLSTYGSAGVKTLAEQLNLDTSTVGRTGQKKNVNYLQLCLKNIIYQLIKKKTFERKSTLEGFRSF